MSKQKKEKPVFGTKEWARYNENCIAGCANDCRYCYAKSMAVRFGRKTPDTWSDEVVSEKKLKGKFTKRDGRIMFPTTHDITPDNLSVIMIFLENILKAGNEVLIVSKPHPDCIETITRQFMECRGQILFRFTIGSCNNEVLRFWDKNAPGFEERLASLSYAFGAGFQTSVSCEPLLDNQADELIMRIRPYVTDAIWIGKPNRLMGRLKYNGHNDSETTARAESLLRDLSDDYINDLYNCYRDDTLIKWKESVKRVVGIDIPVVSGLDI